MILSEVDQADGRVVQFSNLRTLIIPRRFHFLWDQVKIGASIYDLSLRLRAQPANESSRVFLEVSSFLCFLVDHDLIDDIRVVRLADSIRGEYEWPQDLLSNLSIEGSIFAWARRAVNSKRGSARIPLASRSFDFLSVLFVLLSVPCTLALGLLLFDSSEISAAAMGAVFVSGFFLGGTVGRTGVGVLRSFAASIGGDAGELKWKLDLLGPHLVFEAHTVTGVFRRAADFVMCFGSVAVPLLLILLVKSYLPSWPLTIWPVLLSPVLFVAALTTHPSTRSELTKSLRVWNRTPLVWREDDELREVELFHRLGGFVSLLLAAVFFGQIIIALLKLQPDVTFLRFNFATSALFVVAVVFALIVYLGPFFQHDLPGASKRNRRRRLWATRSKVLSIAASDREAWAELPVLRQLTAPLRRQLIGASRVVLFKRGSAICRQGDSDRSLFIVLQGRLAVARSYEGRRRKVVAILSEGAVFGETAFFFGTARTADVVAMDECQLLEIPYLKMMKDLDLSSSADFQFRVWLLQSLAGNAMLKDLPSEAMDTLIFAGARKQFRAGEAVFTEGAPATTCYFIAQGQASALQNGRKINEMKAGDAFGEIALLRPGSRRTASVVADSDLLCMELEIDAFWALLAARLPLGAEIERLALRRLRADEERREKNL